MSDIFVITFAQSPETLLNKLKLPVHNLLEFAIIIKHDIGCCYVDCEPNMVPSIANIKEARRFGKSIIL